MYLRKFGEFVFEESCLEDWKEGRPMSCPVIFFKADKLSEFVRTEQPPRLVFLEKEFLERGMRDNREYIESDGVDRRFMVMLSRPTLQEIDPGNLLLIRDSIEVWRYGSDRLFEESSWEGVERHYDRGVIKALFTLSGAKKVQSVGWYPGCGLEIRFDESLAIQKPGRFLKNFAHTFRQRVQRS